MHFIRLLGKRARSYREGLRGFGTLSELNGPEQPDCVDVTVLFFKKKKE